MDTFYFEVYEVDRRRPFISTYGIPGEGDLSLVTNYRLHTKCEVKTLFFMRTALHNLTLFFDVIFFDFWVAGPLL